MQESVLKHRLQDQCSQQSCPTSAYSRSIYSNAPGVTAASPRREPQGW